MFSHLKKLTSGVTSFFRSGMELVYPAGCPLCGVEDFSIDADRLRPEFCNDCTTNLIPDSREHCLRCGAPVGPHLSREQGCSHCQKDNFRFKTVHALGLYDELLRDACLQMKQPGTEPLAAALAHLMYQHVRADLCAFEIDFIVPVPHHWWDRLLQTSHASTSIAQCLAKEMQVPCSQHLLYKSKRTAKQAELSPTSRRSNVRQAFKVHRARDLSGCTILLVDDVLTTGATSHEGARALKQAGAKEVHVAVIARGLGQSTAMKNTVG